MYYLIWMNVPLRVSIKFVMSIDLSVTLVTNNIIMNVDTCIRNMKTQASRQPKQFMCPSHRGSITVCECVYNHRGSITVCVCVYSHSGSITVCARVYSHRGSITVCVCVYSHRAVLLYVSVFIATEAVLLYVPVFIAT